MSSEEVLLVRNTKLGFLENHKDLESENENRGIVCQKILLFADSHGRGVQELLSERLPGDVDLKVNVVPNGKLKHVMANISSKFKSMSRGDVVIIMGGTNDVEVQSSYRLTLHQAFQTLPLEWKARIVFMTIPERFDINVTKERADANGLVGRLIQLIVTVHFTWVASEL